MQNNNKQIVYIYSDKLKNECDRLPTLINRASIIQDLIESYNLLKNPTKITIVESIEANENDLKLFHSSSYVEFLKKVNDYEDFDEYEEELAEFGLDYDCPILEKTFDLISTIGGSSIFAAKILIENKCNIAINWFGGWHHAQRDAAQGFCYVNDAVLAIQKLSEHFNKILYLDLDIHHGDGVQNAFEYSKKILTLSFHKFQPGFYPGTGSLEEIGSNKGKYYSINVPFLQGISSKPYLKAFNAIFSSVFNAFKPQVMVVQCGADSLNGDSLGESNLTLKTIGNCIENVLKCEIPLLFLGGGGYNFENTARLWTYLTSIITEQSVDNDIPDCSEFFTNYGPSFELHINEGYQKDKNNDEYINKIIDKVLSYCQYID